MDSVQQLGLGSGMLVAVPIPAEHAAEGEEVEAAIRKALVEATEKGISGNKVGQRELAPDDTPVISSCPKRPPNLLI